MHVCIVGAGSDIAGALIEFYAVRNYYITAVCYHNDPKVSNTILRYQGLHVYTGRNMTTDEAVVLKNIPPIDLLVTLTGKVNNAKITEMRSDQWWSVIDANVTTVFNALKYGLPNVKDGGSVVVVGSVVGRTGGYGCANYATAKAALRGLVISAANESVGRGVRVNLLELGYVNAGMGKQLPPKVALKVLDTIPMKRFAEAAEVVEAIDALSKLTYMTGGVLTLAGGL